MSGRLPFRPPRARAELAAVAADPAESAALGVSLNTVQRDADQLTDGGKLPAVEALSAGAPMPESAALVRVALARQDVQRVQREVGAGREGAAVLHQAEWRLHQALRDLSRQPAVEDHDPPDAA